MVAHDKVLPEVPWFRVLEVLHDLYHQEYPCLAGLEPEAVSVHEIPTLMFFA